MASATFKAMAYVGASLLSLALIEGTALAETKQREQELAQVQVSPQQEGNLTAEQVQALESDIDRLNAQGRYTEATKLQHRVLTWREIDSGPEHPDTASSVSGKSMTPPLQPSCRAFTNASKTERVVLRPSPAPRPNSDSIPSQPRGINPFGLLFNSAVTGDPSQTSEHCHQNKTRHHSASRTNETKPPTHSQQEHSIKVFVRMGPAIIISQGPSKFMVRTRQHSISPKAHKTILM